jgi:hypothetical protein
MNKNQSKFALNVATNLLAGLLTILILTACTKEECNCPSVTIPTDGLIAYYPFNGNAHDESGNGHNPVEITATLTTDRNGNSNAAYQFDGDLGQFIKIPDHDALDPLNDFAFTFWINPQSYASVAGQILNKYKAFVNNEGAWAAQLDPNHLGVSPGFWSNSIIPLNTWTFGALVFTKASNAYSVYLNGELDASGTCPVVIQNNPRDLYIGIHESVEYGNFHGKIDDIRMYNCTLTEEQVMAIYNE